MRRGREGGIGERVVPGLEPGLGYKFEIRGPDGSRVPLKADPVACAAQHPPATAARTAPVTSRRTSAGSAVDPPPPAFRPDAPQAAA